MKTISMMVAVIGVFLSVGTADAYYSSSSWSWDESPRVEYYSRSNGMYGSDYYKPRFDDYGYRNSFDGSYTHFDW